MKQSELLQIIKEEISKAVNPPVSSTSKAGTVSGGSISTLATALNGIGVEDPKIAGILGKLKNIKYNPSMGEKDIIVKVFRQMMNTSEDAALTKVFNALKQMEAK
jgi:hypothetical protein